MNKCTSYERVNRTRARCVTVRVLRFLPYQEYLLTEVKHFSYLIRPSKMLLNDGVRDSLYYIVASWNERGVTRDRWEKETRESPMASCVPQACEGELGNMSSRSQERLWKTGLVMK